jgi:hypothetical protein
MTALLPESSFSQDAPVNSVMRMTIGVPVGRIVDSASEDSHEEWRGQVRRLQQLVCDLLVENQQLRWALMEMKEHELRDNEGPAKHKASK